MAIMKKHSPKMYLLLLAMVFAFRNSVPTFAADDANSTTMPEVVVSGQQNRKSYKIDKVSSSKYQGPLVDLPQTLTIIPKQVIQDQGATSLREVLRNTPGISMQAGEGGTPAGDQMTIRGFSARTDIFVDNVRDFGGYSRDPFNLEQVEVFKGPASSYAGRGSTGGSINLVSKTPSLDAFQAGSIGLGTDDYKRATVDFNQPFSNGWVDGTALRLNLLYHGNEFSERDIAEDERWGIAPSIAFGLETPTRVILSYFHLSQDNTPDYGHPWIPPTSANGLLTGLADQPAPVNRSNFYGLIDRDYENIDTDMGTVLFEHDFNDLATLQNIFRYGRTKRDSIITPPRFVMDSSTEISRGDWKSRDQVDEIWSNQTTLTYEVNTGPFIHGLVGGMDLAREEEVNHGRVSTDPGPVTDLYHPDPYQDFTGVISRNGAKAEATSNSIAFYGYDNIQLHEKWEVNGGLRWDYFDVEAVPLSGNPPVSGSRFDRVDQEISWRTSLVYKPVESGSIYFAYGTSFNPSAEGLTLNENTVNLEPEESVTYEGGTKWEFFNNNLNVSAAIFRTDKSNARTPVLPGEPALVLDGEQRVDGFELGAAGNITDKWSVFTGYTLLSSEVLESNTPAEVGKHVSNTPDNTFNVWTTYELPWNFEIGFGFLYVDERFNNNNNLRKAPDYCLMDAMLAYHYNENITIRLNVYNLADEEYIDRMSGGHFIPGTGRAAIVSTEFEF